ncbi:MAG TPA: KOW motif domain-containing protein, partial [Aestuariivirgaceae bacterium]|nr:KOW motif domain-containing protein [Aestuariivirgaceae bacterium]
MARKTTRTRSPRVADIRSGDEVLVLSGKEAGKRGTVERVVRNRQGFKKIVNKYGSNWRRVSPLADVAVVVEGLNIAKRHTKPRPKQGRTERQPR